MCKIFIFFLLFLNYFQIHDKDNKKRAGKWKHTKREALLIGIPHENVNLYAEIEELVGFLENNKQIETEEEKRTLDEIVDYLISR